MRLDCFQEISERVIRTAASKSAEATDSTVRRSTNGRPSSELGYAQRFQRGKMVKRLIGTGVSLYMRRPDKSISWLVRIIRHRGAFFRADRKHSVYFVRGICLHSPSRFRCLLPHPARSWRAMIAHLTRFGMTRLLADFRGHTKPPNSRYGEQLPIRRAKF